MMKRKKFVLPPPKELLLPPHWPQYCSPEYYRLHMKNKPADAQAADWSKQAPNNSYSTVFWYQDRQRICLDCGCEFVFSKEEQQFWYEEAKISLYVSAVYCAACRAKRRAAKNEQRAHMAQVAAMPPHPHEAFFKQRFTDLPAQPSEAGLNDVAEDE